MNKLLFVLTLLILPSSLGAQETTPAWTSHRELANQLSNVGVIGQAVGVTWANWQKPNHWQALACEGLRFGVAMGATEVLKHAIHRERPDGSDHLSIPSGHTTAVTALAGWKLQASVPLAFGVGYLKTAGNRHRWSDVAAGALVGGLASWWTPLRGC